MSTERPSRSHKRLIHKSNLALDAARSLRKSSQALQVSSALLREEVSKLFDAYTTQSHRQEEIEKQFRK